MIQTLEASQPIEIELKVVANPETGFLTVEERIQKKIIETLTSVDLIRNDNVGTLYLCKFVKNYENETSIVIKVATPVFDDWKLRGWDLRGCPKSPDFYIQEVVKPDPKVLKLLKRRLLNTPYYLRYLEHTLAGFYVQPKRYVSDGKISLIYRTIRKANCILHQAS
jgi:hypothetical protein